MRKEMTSFGCPSSTHLHFSRFVVAAILVFISGAVAITEEAFEAVFTPQLADNLVQCLTVEGVVVHCEGRIADGGKQGCICVLPGRKGLVDTNKEPRPQFCWTFFNFFL